MSSLVPYKGTIFDIVGVSRRPNNVDERPKKKPKFNSPYDMKIPKLLCVCAKFMQYESGLL